MPAPLTDTSAVGSRPRLCRDLATVVFGESLLVEGGPQRHVFRGRAATEVLPRLLPLLDGTRDSAAIAGQLGLTQRQAEQVLSLLTERGLLESAAPPAPPRAASDPAVLGWFSRNLPESGGYACAEEVLAVLADTTVLIAGTPAEVVDALARDLTGGGVGEVLTVGPDEPPAKGCAGRRVIAVVVGADTPPGLMDAYIPVLHVAMTAEHVEIGPVLFPGFGACPECLRRSRAEAGSSLTNSHGNENGIVDLAAGLAASEAIALAARLPSGADPRTLTRFSIVDWSTETFWVVPYDDCDTCAVPSAPDLFEWSVQDRPIPLAPGREIPPWEMRRIQELKKQRPLLPTLPRRDLPSANEEVWATLLRQTAGIHEAPPGTPVRRWAPCGGGLASVELYLVDEHGFPGLPGTAFRYDDLGHRLVAVRDDQIRVADLLADTGLDPDADRAEAAIVLVAAHARLAAKYRQFAYRLAHLDAGCASTQLTMVARAHGLEVRFATHWDGRIAEALGLARDDPFITAVATVSRRPVLTPKETACR